MAISKESESVHPETKEDWIEVLETICGTWSDTEEEYELKLSHLAHHYRPGEDGDIAILLQIIEEKLQQKDADGNEGTDRKTAYAAFYCLSIILRSIAENGRLNRLYLANEDWCSSFESYPHLVTCQFLDVGMSTKGDNIDESSAGLSYSLIEQQRSLMKKYPDHAGFAHAFCDLCVTICEENAANIESMAAYLEECHKAIDKAHQIRKRQYAKFYCTEGRLFAVEGEYEKAEQLIHRAIQLEDSMRSDYSVRIGLYQYHRLQIQFKKMMEESLKTVNDNVNSAQKTLKKLQDSMIGTVEMIAFFAAIISFTIGSLSLAKGQTVFHATLLIISLTGCLIAVYSTFALLLRNKNRLPGIIIIGVILAVGSSLLAYFLH